MSVRIEETVEEKGRYEIIVAGGGIAGVAAAVTAKRLGKKVLLVEKSMKLGGLATLGLINFWVPICNGRGKQIIHGMVDELLPMSIAFGYGDIPEGFETGQIPQEKLDAYKKEGKVPPRYATRYSAEIFALQMTELCHQEGVDIMFDTILSRPVMNAQNPKHIDGVIVENKSGRSYYAADLFIDVTGDGDLMYRAGVPVKKRGNFHTYGGFEVNLKTCQDAIDRQDIQYAHTGAHGGNATLYGDFHPADVELYDGTEESEVNRYLIDNQLQMLDQYKDPSHRKERDLITLPGMAQFRTTRRIDGAYVLQESDVYRHFEDSIGAMNDFDRRDYLFEIPYRTMIADGFDNIITAGRSAAGEGYAWDCLRVIPPAVVTGQAAGAACALALDAQVPITKVDIAALQAELTRENVVIHFDDADVPAESSNVIEHND